jgi:hypothetical protein
MALLCFQFSKLKTFIRRGHWTKFGFTAVMWPAAVWLQAAAGLSVYGG